MTTLSIELHVDGRRCLIVGGGAVATRRARVLADAGAVVEVVSPAVDPELAALIAARGLTLRRRRVEQDDLAASPAGRLALVVAATDRPDVNAVVTDWARAEGVPVNRADDAAAGDVSFPAVLDRGPLRVAVSTGGRSPTVSGWAAGRLDEGLDALLGLDAEGLATLVEVFAEVRAELRLAVTQGSEARTGSDDVGGGARMDLID
ncbi:MAG: precorrin-2 dehydrogenase/sirohydrochlorin ferrochelatase family protein, partial [Microthrixaceae bacterium]